MEPLVCLEYKDLPDQLEVQDNQVMQGNLDHRALLVNLGHLVPMVSLVKLDRMVKWETVDLKERQEILETLGPKAKLEIQELTAKMVHRE